MKNTNKLIVLLSFLFLFSCEKEIEIELPDSKPKLVVEGRIETGIPPIIILSKTTGYFEPTDNKSIANAYINDATITISDGTTTLSMFKVCSSLLTTQQKKDLAGQVGIAYEILEANDICGFTAFTMLGQPGKSYTIKINWEGEEYVSTTTVPPSVSLDSSWFKIHTNRDSLGFLWAKLNEPAPIGHNYRWFAKRINTYKYGKNKGEQKDNRYTAPFGSAFEDKFINEIDFELGYNRASGTEKADDFPPERGFYKKGDTVALKFCTIDLNVFKYVDKSGRQVRSTGSPFASPTNVPSNISNGGLGIWAGYGVFHDTIICK